MSHKVWSSMLESLPIAKQRLRSVLMYDAQAYDREMLRMKGPGAVTNFPAHTYGLLGTAQNGQQRGKFFHLCAMIARYLNHLNTSQSTSA